MKVLKWIGIIIIAALLATFIAWRVNEKNNETVHLTEYTFSDEDVPKAFNGFKIMHISDLHEAPFSNQILNYVRRQKPDIIVFTGDMAPLPEDTIDETVKIAKEAGDIPVYAVSGNHETQGGSYDKIIEELKGAGITPLDDDGVFIERGLDSILLTGVKDPKDGVVSEEKIEKMREQIKSELPEEPCFSVLLMHRADLYPKIKDTGVDLILSGHLHGGIIRLPFIGGLIGKEDNGALPEYEYGFFSGDGAADMIVSGGCDKNPKKKRFFNPPEVVLITLEKERY